MSFNKSLSFDQIIKTLEDYWRAYGCAILQSYDLEMGAGTFHPHTTLYGLGSKPWKFAHVQATRRPGDGRYGENPNRLMRFNQFQVLLKPSPDNIQELFIESLASLGLSDKENDIRFVEDDWENPSLGASGLGWEVWCNGMEVAQFTYMQKIGGIDCEIIPGEIAYGVERIAMYIQDCNSIMDLHVNNPKYIKDQIVYRDLFYEAEKQLSVCYMEKSNAKTLFNLFALMESESLSMLENKLPWPAYEYCVKASHYFNILDSRGLIGTLERANYIARLRDIAKEACKQWVEISEHQGQEE